MPATNRSSFRGRRSARQVDLPVAAVDRFELRYRLSDVTVRSTPSTAGRALAAIGPLTGGVDNDLPVLFIVSGGTVLGLNCPLLPFSQQSCGSQVQSAAERPTRTALAPGSHLGSVEAAPAIDVTADHRGDGEAPFEDSDGRQDRDAWEPDAAQFVQVMTGDVSDGQHGSPLRMPRLPLATVSTTELHTPVANSPETRRWVNRRLPSRCCNATDVLGSYAFFQK